MGAGLAGGISKNIGGAQSARQIGLSPGRGYIAWMISSKWCSRVVVRVWIEERIGLGRIGIIVIECWGRSGQPLSRLTGPERL